MNTDDRTLLERAARAAGIALSPDGEWSWRGIKLADGPHNYWNPLTDDGDALRLAVQLGISIHSQDPEKLVHEHSPVVDARQEGFAVAKIEGYGYRHSAPHLRRWSCAVHWVSMAEYERVKNCKEEWRVQFWRDNCPEKFENAYTATRRAITRAAAQIGMGGEHG